MIGELVGGLMGGRVLGDLHAGDIDIVCMVGI